MTAAEDSNGKTIHQHNNIDESTQIVKAADSLDTQEQIVSVLEEDFSISKQTTVREAKIEKRAVTKIKTIKVPITYEELYVNGKKLKSVDEPRILSALKDKISSITSSSGNSDASVEQSVSKKKKIEDRGELVTLFSSSYDNEESETELKKKR
jgi:hypothetical protein